MHRLAPPVSTFYSYLLLLLVLALPTNTGCTVVSDYGEDYLASNTTPSDVLDAGSIGDAPVPSDGESHDSVSPSDSTPHADAIHDMSGTEIEGDGSLPDTGSPADVSAEDTGNVSDGGPVTPPSNVNALFDVRGRIHIVEYHDYTGNTWQTGASDVNAALKAGAVPHGMGLVNESAQCRLYVAMNPSCDPSCNPDEVCTADATCKPIPGPSDGGKIVISGLQGATDPTNLTLGVTDDGSYAIEGPPLAKSNLFEPGNPITVTMEGSGSLAPIELTLKGVNDMQYNGSEKPLIRLKDSEDFVFEWDPTGQEERVELTLKTGPWLSGQSPEGVLICSADSAEGSIVIPQNLVASFPYFDGKTNDQHPSYVRRLHRTFVETDSGPIDMSVISESYLFTIHEQP
jgi:hypothetical protein